MLAMCVLVHMCGGQMSNLACHFSGAIHLLDFLRLSPWDLGLPHQSRLVCQQSPEICLSLSLQL